MKKYLLDTALLSALLFGRTGAVNLVQPWLASREAVTSILVYGEVNEYIQGNPNYVQFHDLLLELLKEIPAVFITYPIILPAEKKEDVPEGETPEPEKPLNSMKPIWARPPAEVTQEE